MATNAQDTITTKFLAGENGYLKFRFGLSSHCMVRARCALIDTSTGTVVGKFTKRRIVNSGVHMGKWQFELPQELASGTRIRTVLIIDKRTELGGPIVRVAKDQRILVIE